MDGKLKFSNNSSELISTAKVERQVRQEWADFAFKKRIVYWLLSLLTLSIGFAFTTLILGLTGKFRITAFLVIALIGGTLGPLGRLLNNVLRSIFRE